MHLPPLLQDGTFDFLAKLLLAPDDSNCILQPIHFMVSSESDIKECHTSTDNWSKPRPQTCHGKYEAHPYVPSSKCLWP